MRTIEGPRPPLPAVLSAAGLVVSIGVTAHTAVAVLPAVGLHGAGLRLGVVSLALTASLVCLLWSWAAPRRTPAPGDVDPLTGAARVPAMLDRLAHATASSSRHGRDVAVMVLDLDGFGEVNATFDHAVGDHVLMEAAARLGDVARRTDLVCRSAGDEFVLVVEHLDGQSGAAVVADKVLATLRDPVPVGPSTVAVTGSLGIALCPQDTDTPGELLDLARGALRTARDAGGDTYRFSSVDLRAEHAERQATLGELRAAIEQDELELAYQPQIDLRTGAVVAAEALLRWRRTEGRAAVPAGRFIAMTENSELAERIGRWVVDTAVAQVAAWQAAGPRSPGVAVNVGLRHLRHGDLPGELRVALERHGVDPAMVEVEVPESALGADPDRVVPVLHALGALGVRIVLDEFGTGQTSLAQLPDLPLHAIKLDVTLGDRLAGSGAAMVAGLVGLGRELGLQVVVPRVEHAGQLRRARHLGCHRAQGYLLSPPVSPDRLLAHVTGVATMS